MSIRLVILAAGALLAGPPSLTAQTAPPAIEGVWYLNRELSDIRPPTDDSAAEGRGRGGPGGGRGPGGPGPGGVGRGGFGGGFGGGMGGRGGPGGGRDPEAMRRRMEAMSAILAAAERLTIVRTESMVILTSDQGITTRLAPDGTRVKDQSTGIERRTRWEAGRLISEISGAGSGRITEVYGVDAESGRLLVEVKVEGGRGRGGSGEPRTLKRVYEKDE